MINFSLINLTIWISLFLLQLSDISPPYTCTIYLPISFIALIINESRSRHQSFCVYNTYLLSCLFFFSISIILWPVSNYSPLAFNSLVSVEFKPSELDYAASLIGLSVAITNSSVAYFRIRNNQSDTNQILDYRNSRQKEKLFYKIGITLMLTAAPAVSFELYKQFIYIKNAGYLALFSEGIEIPLYAKVFIYIFNTGFGLVLCFAKEKKQFIIPAVFFIIISLLNSLKGARGAVIVPMLFVFWYYTSRFRITINIRKVFVFVSILIGSFAALTYARSTEGLSRNEGLLQFSIDAISSQGRSLQLLAYYNRVKSDVGRYGSYMIFSNLTIPITIMEHPEIRDSAQSLDHVLYSNNLKHILTYVANPSYYLAGGGTGGVHIIELEESGPFLFIAFSVLLGLFFANFSNLMTYPSFRFLSFYLFSTVFYMPRGEFFFNSLILGKALILYLVIKLVFMYRLRF